MVKATLEIMYSRGDKKLRYNTAKKQQVIAVMEEIQDMKIGKSGKTVMEEITQGTRLVMGVTQEQKFEHIEIGQGVVPPEEQMQEFLANERFTRHCILPTVAGG